MTSVRTGAGDEITLDNEPQVAPIARLEANVQRAERSLFVSSGSSEGAWGRVEAGP